ncbi:hypothetical protein HanXRQr2_Chr16g0746731 [Helianthus annuus]|uniref:Uncharacterized protein n=1 Tax=Helianthus annuus TaxID=4232 RepID=A0A251RRU7_HELAN|nr:hypothetical protein HanXRQr2_Chr16g0746731 [Helianthus annuus]
MKSVKWERKLICFQQFWASHFKIKKILSLDTWSLHREEQVVVEHGSWMPC